MEKKNRNAEAKKPAAAPTRGAAAPARGAAAAFPIVCLGASAGGLQALSRFFGRIPPDTGMAFVLVQHLAPDHESLLSEILRKVARIPVAEALEGDRVAPDCVYVIPPGKTMSIEDGHLLLSKRPFLRGQVLVVDHFLQSLARERHRKAIAVILSGTSHDGALGAEAVKAEGGIVFAQDPKSAEHSGMPDAAIATGAADYVLSPEDIAAELVRLARHPLVATKLAAGAPPEAEKALARIFMLLRGSTGLDFSHYKRTTIWRRLSRRVILHRLDSLERYVELLEKDPAEVRALHDELLIHVTQFFRDLPAFEALRSKVFPKLLAGGRPDSPIRLWVPGCSTGEEAYSLAIWAMDYLSGNRSGRAVQVFASDVSHAAIERARLGVFPESIAEAVPPRLLRQYFAKAERGYQVAKRVREACVFARQNLVQDPPFANMDLISCRNVLIYLDPLLQKRVAPILHYALRPGGALLLGGAEGLGEFASYFTLVDKRWRIFMKKPGVAHPRLAMFPQAGAPAEPPPGPRARTAFAPAFPEADVQKVADRLLLAKYAPAGVVVNGDLDILHFRGRVNRFLEPAPGKASLNLLKMLPEDCQLELRGLVQKAKSRDAVAREKALRLTVGGARRLVNVEVLPFQVPLSSERYFIVSFAEEAAPAGARAARGRGAPRAAPDGGMERRLRRELSATRAYLQSSMEEQQAANEELKTANEEIVSSNEELQSTNEELETAKEELQAANEELTTVNEELQSRNAELSQSANDVTNLLASAQLPVVMVGSDLRIRRFTPLAEKLMYLAAADVGRPIGEIKLKLLVPDLEGQLLEVIETMAAREFELQDEAGHWHLLRMRPYKTGEAKIEGAVLTLVDIDAVKRGMHELRENAAFAAAVFDMAAQPLAVLDTELRVKSASRSFYRAFGLTAAVVGRPLVEAAGWAGARRLREAFANLARTGEPFEDVPASAGGRDLGFSARRILTEGRAVSYVLTVNVLAKP